MSGSGGSKDPVLPIRLNAQILQLCKQIYSSPDTPLVSRGAVVVSEHNPAGAKQRVGNVDVGPGGVEIMRRVHFDQVRVNPPLAETRQRRHCRERDGQDGQG